MIGILPAAGQATRIHGLPKYLLPVPGEFPYLIDRQYWLMRDVQHVLIFVGAASSESAEFIDQYIDDLCYIAKHHDTMTQTVLSVQMWIEQKDFRRHPVLFGMPDTYIDDEQVYPKLRASLVDGADVAVALFEARPGQHREGGMCDVVDGQVVRVIDKPETSDYRYIWGALAWRPLFWDCLDPNDPHVGYGLPRAIERGLDVRAVHCSGGFWDCGTPERYFALIRHLTEPEYVPAHRT